MSHCEKRIKLGIWGLGRGMSFYKSCEALGIDVVAGCDYNEWMRNRFLEHNPNVLATPNAEEFLQADMDAVLVATYCPAHAGDAIACLERGKHVLSEVTGFHTMAEGVRLVEAVQESGCVYNLAENYPFGKPMMFLRSKWEQGLFGELMYAECEYVHECRSLAYTYIDGTPIIPGNTVHNWRSWIHFHYYNTHSLGPVMLIGGVRPVRVVSLPATVRLAGFLKNSQRGMGGVAPSLIQMDNGAVMRNLMGATTNDSHIQRFWGTLGSAELVDNELRFRLGASGQSPKMAVQPEWPRHGDLASATGHGGGDFWTLFYFAREIRTGIPAPFSTYSAADCTIPGILAYRSSLNQGQPYDIPDFRNKSERDKYRDDDTAQPGYNVDKGCFPDNADFKLTGQFSTIMRDLIKHVTNYRAYTDWSKATDDMKEPAKVAELAEGVINSYPEMVKTIAGAKRLVEAYPESDGAQVLGEMLELVDQKAINQPDFVENLKNHQEQIRTLSGKEEQKNADLNTF